MSSKVSVVEQIDIPSAIGDLYLTLNKNKNEFSTTTLSRINNKLVASQEFVENIDKPLHKEILYLILWSCLNEISFEILEYTYPELKFRKFDPIKPVDCDSGRKYCYPYEVDRYHLSPSEIECSLYFKSSANPNAFDIRKISFYIQAYLLEHNANKHIRLLFDYLNKIRNRLSLIHGFDSSKDYKKSTVSIDMVTLDDCRWMLRFLEFVFDISSGIEQDPIFFKSKKDRTSMDYFNVRGIISDLKSETRNEKVFYKLELEYIAKQGNTEKMSIGLDKKDYVKLEKGDQISVDFEIKFKYPFNNIYSRKIAKIISGPS